MNLEISDSHSELDIVLKNLEVRLILVHIPAETKNQKWGGYLSYYFILFETNSYCVARVVPKLLDASDPPASTSKGARTTGGRHTACPVSFDRQTPVCHSLTPYYHKLCPNTCLACTCRYLNFGSQLEDPCGCQISKAFAMDG